MSTAPEDAGADERLRRLTAVGRALTWARSVEHVVDIAVRGAHELFATDRVEILLRRPEGFEPAGECGRFVPLADVRRHLREAFEVEPAVVPLVARGELSGLLAVPASSVPADRGWILSSLADQVAVALDSAATEADQEVETVAAKLRIETERRHVREIALQALGHDVRSPLHGVQMILEMLGGGMLGPITPEQADMVARARAGCRAINKAIEEILAVFGRADPQSLAVASERVPLRAALDRLAEELRDRLDQARMQLEVRCDEGLACRADPLLLHRLLVNVVDNAIRYAREGGYVGVEAQADALGRVVRVTLSDRGPALSAEEAKRIFDVNQRSGRSAGLSRGQGLGLTLARELARRMEGDLVCEPGPAGEARFVLTLPAG